MSKDKPKKPGALRTVDASFNVWETGWSKFGNHRKYIAENVNRIVNGDIVQERVGRRVMVGFFGHNSNRALEATENADNLASHITTRLKFHPASGDVEHRQEFIDTKPGRAALSLHDSNIGNFSWRGKAKSSIMSENSQFDDSAAGHLRFDYVYVPGMVNQPKRDVHISEGVEDSPQLKELLERCQAHGLEEEESLKMLDDWQMRGVLLEEDVRAQDIMSMEVHLLQTELSDRAKSEEERARLVQEAVKASPYALQESTINFLTGVRDFSEPGEVVEAINDMMQYRDLELGNRFPGQGTGERKYLPREAFVPAERKREFDPANSVLGAYYVNT